jgi:hypothetical protein
MSSLVLIGPQPSPSALYAPAETTTLREIEQEIARRVGPFFMRSVHNYSPGQPPQPVSTTTTIAIDAIRSTMDLGGLDGMFVLRRGRLSDGTRLPADDSLGNPRPFVADDRIRMVRQYRPQDGLLEVDRGYTYPTYDGEEVELHHLDPEEELRPAALSGLRRTYVVDVTNIPYASQGVPPVNVVDLTLLAPWITTRDQVYNVTMFGGAPLTGWRVEPYGGGLMVSLREWSYGSAYVVNRRPAVAMVLAFNAPPGQAYVVRKGTVNEPWDDEDAFPVPMDYAAAAGHIEAWRTARPRLSATAQTGMFADQKETAAEFNRVVTVYFDPPRYEPALSISGRRWLDNPLSNAP